MKIRLRGKYWELTRTKNLRSRGDIDNPDAKNKDTYQHQDRG